jgi:hypothetical protein
VVENEGEMTPPTDEVLQLVEQGLSNEEIITTLQTKGYSNVDISEAISQANTKASVEGTSMQQPTMQRSIMDTQSTAPPPPPEAEQVYATPQSESMAQGFDRGDIGRMEEIAEAIIDEKWKRVLDEVGDLSVWKEKVKTDVTSIKQELMRLENRFELVQKALLGKVKDYDQGMEEVGTDIRALEKLLKNILNPLTTNVKELRSLTEKLKKG